MKVGCPDCGLSSHKWEYKGVVLGLDSYRCSCSTVIYWDHKRQQYYVWVGEDKLYFPPYEDEGEEE